MDIMRFGENSIYKEYASEREAGEAMLSMGVSTWIPTSFLKSANFSINAASVAKTGKKITEAIGKVISSQKQARHLAGTAKGGGYLNSLADAQKALDAVHSGEAVFLGTTKGGHAVYRYAGVTGTNVNAGVGIMEQPTNLFMIKGTTSPSVVPTSPAWLP